MPRNQPLCLSIAFLLTLTAGTCHAGLQETLDARLTKALQQVEAKDRQRRNALAREYVGYLKRLVAHYKEQATLEGVIAVQHEIKRYAAARSLEPADVVESLPELAAAQQHLLEQQQGLAAARAEDLVGVYDRFLGGLDRVQQKLVKADEVDKALAVKQLGESWKTDSDYLEARRTVAAARERAAAVREEAHAASTSAPDAGKPGVPPGGRYLIESDVVRGAKKSLDDPSRDYDDTAQNVQLKLELLCRDPVHDYHGLTAKVWALGRSVTNKKIYQVVLKEEFKADLDRGRPREFHTGSVTLKYDDNDTAQYGYKFYGYVLKIVDAEGTVIHEKATSSRLLKLGSKLDTLQPGGTFSL